MGGRPPSAARGRWADLASGWPTVFRLWSGWGSGRDRVHLQQREIGPAGKAALVARGDGGGCRSTLVHLCLASILRPVGPTGGWPVRAGEPGSDGSSGDGGGRVEHVPSRGPVVRHGIGSSWSTRVIGSGCRCTCLRVCTRQSRIFGRSMCGARAVVVECSTGFSAGRIGIPAFRSRPSALHHDRTRRGCERCRNDRREWSTDDRQDAGTVTSP